MLFPIVFLLVAPPTKVFRVAIVCRGEKYILFLLDIRGEFLHCIPMMCRRIYLK